MPRLPIYWFAGATMTGGELFMIWLSVFFLLSATVAVCAIFISRLVKSSREKKAAVLRTQFRKMLNIVIVNHTMSKGSSPSAILNYRLEEIKTITRHWRSGRQILIDEIIQMKKNISGNAVTILKDVYHNLGLITTSRSKLSSVRWYEQAKGVREVSEMEDYQSLPAVKTFLTSRNEILHHEAILAMMKLEKEAPLRFLDSFVGDIRPWMVVNIYQYLSSLPQDNVPQFKRWLHTNNESVALFSLKMIRQLRQTAAVADVAELTKHHNSEIVALAILTIGDFEAFEFAEILLSSDEVFWINDAACEALMKTIGKIGAGDHAIRVAKKFTEHPSYDVRFHAHQVLKNLGVRDQNVGLDKKILDHINEPLLQ
jgi:hypothetical protein